METITTPTTEAKKRGRKPTGIKKEPLFLYVPEELLQRINKADLRKKINDYLKTI